jgi:hypothetical protein
MRLSKKQQFPKKYVLLNLFADMDVYLNIEVVVSLPTQERTE